jgi:PAS domain S-box-containing protein
MTSSKADTGEFDGLNFFEMTPDLVCIATKEGFFKKVNDAVISKLKYTEEELFSRPISDFIHPEDRALTSKGRTNLLKGQQLLNFENRYIAKSGEIIWLEWTSIYFPDREIVFAIAKDVSERKKLDHEVHEKYNKFKSLATHFKSSLELDKKFLATELHEELAQLASVVKMDIDWVRSNSPDLSAASKSRIEHALAISDLLITSMRRISFSLSPAMLDDLGLNATLEWHCREFSILNGIPCGFKSAYHEISLGREARLDFFRVCQEALTNVMYHAEASSVNITIEEIDNKIILSIQDDGKGFNLKHQKPMPGLKRMHERAASINGMLVVKSKKGKGTTINLSVPKASDQN